MVQYPRTDKRGSEKLVTHQFVAQTQRERELVKELNSSNHEIEELRFNLARAKARITQLETALKKSPTFVVPPDNANERILQPGEPGYKTIVRTTAQGRKFVNNPDLYNGPAAGQFIMALGTNNGGANLDKMVEVLTPLAISRATVIYQIKLLNKLAYIEVDYVKVVNGS